MEGNERTEHAGVGQPAVGAAPGGAADVGMATDRSADEANTAFVEESGTVSVGDAASLEVDEEDMKAAASDEPRAAAAPEEDPERPEGSR